MVVLRAARVRRAAHIHDRRVRPASRRRRRPLGRRRRSPIDGRRRRRRPINGRRRGAIDEQPRLRRGKPHPRLGTVVRASIRVARVEPGPCRARSLIRAFSAILGPSIRSHVRTLGPLIVRTVRPYIRPFRPLLVGPVRAGHGPLGSLVIRSIRAFLLPRRAQLRRPLGANLAGAVRPKLGRRGTAACGRTVGQIEPDQADSDCRDGFFRFGAVRAADQADAGACLGPLVAAGQGHTAGPAFRHSLSVPHPVQYTASRQRPNKKPFGRADRRTDQAAARPRLGQCEFECRRHAGHACAEPNSCAGPALGQAESGRHGSDAGLDARHDPGWPGSHDAQRIIRSANAESRLKRD